MNIFSSMRHSIMRSVSKNNRKKTLTIASVAIVVCGLLVGCPEPSGTGDSDGPKLTITAVVSPTSVTTGATATVRVTATNSGTAASAATTAAIHRSDDAAISTEDTKVGEVQIPSIAVNATETVMFTIPITETATTGTRNYGACIGSGATAICSSALTLAVTDTAVPDLSVAGAIPTISESVYGDNSVYGANTVGTISVVVTNSGTANSDTVTVTFYRQKGGTPDASADGDAVGTTTIASISSTPGNNTATATTPFNVGNTEGLAIYYAVVETSGDANMTNNTSAPTAPVAITAAVPDLAITAFTSTPARTTFTASETFTASVTVQNAGGVDAAATMLSLALVDNAGAVVKELATIPVRALVAVAGTTVDAVTLSETITIPADTAAGAYRLRATVGDLTSEANAGNNAFFLGGDLIISATPAPDLDVSGIVPTLTPAATNANYSMGSSITLSVDVTNRGNAASGGGTVTFYRQEGGSPAPGTDTVVGTPQPLSNAGIAVEATETAMVTFNTGVAGTAVRYYAVISAVTSETNSNNNTSALTAPIAITAPAPDLVVNNVKTTVSDATRYVEGNMVTLSVEVTNSGTKNSTDGTVTFYRGAVGSGTQVGMPVTLSTIATDANATATTSMFALSGADVGTAVQYYAVVSGVTDETNTGNNTSMPSDGITILELGPDLDISGVRTTLTAASYTVGATATIRVNVSNTGTENSTMGATVSFYRVAGTEIDRTADGAAVATASIPAITAGMSQEVEAMFNVGSAGATAALYYAVITQVAEEVAIGRNNNTSMVSNPIAINTHPDLVISAFTTGQSTVSAGATITANITVRNNGDLASAATTVSVELLNMDGSAVSPGGLTGSAIDVAAINGGQELMVSGTYTVSTMTPVGSTYRLRAMVAEVASESDATNNTLFFGGNDSPTNFVVSMQLVPDLDIGGVAVTFGTAGTPVTSYDLNTTATINVVVRNGGNAASTNGTVTFYRGAVGSGTVVGTAQTLSGIAIGGMTTATTTFTATPVGTATYYAVVTGATGDTNASNDTSMTAMLTINPLEPDLTLATPTITPGAPYNSSSEITLNVVVTNSGNINSTDGTVTFYREAGVTDVAVGSTHSLGTIMPGMTETATSGAFVIGVGGTVQYYAVVGGVTGETDTDDNTSDATAGITVTAVPDLRITAFTIPASVISGRDETVGVTVVNDGAAMSAATTARVEVFNFAGSTYVINQLITVDPLMPGDADTFSRTITFTANNAADAGVVGNIRARVDTATASGVNPAVFETNTGNNEFVLGGNTPTDFQINYRDLTIDAPSVSGAPYTTGGTATLSATVRNNGNIEVPAGGAVTFYREAGMTDTMVGTYMLDAAIATGGNVTATANITLGAVGTGVQYYAVVSGVTDESNTDNNTSGLSSTPGITIRTPPDLVINTLTTSAASVVAGGTFTASVDVRNDGETGSEPTTVSFALVDTGGTATPLTGSVMVPAVAAGGNSGTQSGTITVPDTINAGRYFLRATIADVTGESDTTNNSYRLGGTPSQPNFEITAPDLTITQFATSVTSAAAGGVFTANVTVGNNGNAGSPDTTVSLALVPTSGAPIPLDGTISIAAFAAGFNSGAQSGTITVPVGTAAGTYRLRATVASVTGETNTSNNEVFLGGTPSSTNFEITTMRETTLNLGGNCVILIGDADDINCGAVRTTDLAANDVIGTVDSSGATGFALANTISNPMFVIHSTSGVVTANRGVAISALPATFDITVTGGVGAGTQRVRITNTVGTKLDETAQIGAPMTSGVTLFTPATSTGRTYACSDQGSGCITSLQTASSNSSDWYANYNSGTTGTALNIQAYERVYIEYNLNNNTISGAPSARFILRLSNSFYRLRAVDGLVADNTWRTISIPLTRNIFYGSTLDLRYLYAIGFRDQGIGVDLSVRAVYFR